MTDENLSHITIEAVDPWRCRMWELHDRHTELLNPERCRSLIRSFKRMGQVFPVLGRRVSGVQGVDFELIYGARRLYAAQQLDVQLIVAVTTVDDLEAVRLTFAENAHRQDVSPYERGTALKRLLREGLFRTQSELAEALGISESTVSRLLAFCSLPTVVLQAFPDLTEVREEWALTMAKLCREDQVRNRLVSRARRLAARDDHLTGAAVYRALIGDESPQREILCRRDAVYKDREGRPVFRVRKTQRKTSLVFETGTVPESQIEALAELACNAIKIWRDEEAQRLRDPALTTALVKDVRSTASSPDAVGRGDRKGSDRATDKPS